MASSAKNNGIHEILNRGILISFCLSLLMGGSVVIVWQIVSHYRMQAYHTRLIREVIRRDASDLITSAMLKNSSAVAFQLKTALESMPIQCAEIELEGQKFPLKGDPVVCAKLYPTSDAIRREPITSGGITIGPLVYILDTKMLPSGSLLHLLLALIALVGAGALTWGVLLKFISDNVLKPLKALTNSLGGEIAQLDRERACDELVVLSEQLAKFRSEIVASVKQEEYVRVARLVAHNIQAPTFSLQGVNISRLSQEDQQTFLTAISDIKELIDNLRSKSGQNPKPAQGIELAPSATPVARDEKPIMKETPTVEHLIGLVDLAVSQKRAQYCSAVDIQFEHVDDAYPLFASIQKVEFRSVLSNLINNAVEAIQWAGRGNGKVTVRLIRSDQSARVIVCDNGPGIDPQAYPRLGECGFSYKKPGGSGLGLYHAKTSAKAWGGQLSIEPNPSGGTIVALELPLAPAPDWFASEIQLPETGELAVLDDDDLVHLMWRQRFKQMNFTNVNVRYFTQAADFKAWYRGTQDREAVCLVDYELKGQEQSGLNVVEELGIAPQSILVTGRFDEDDIVARVRWLGMKMVPKPLAGIVPISFNG